MFLSIIHRCHNIERLKGKHGNIWFIAIVSMQPNNKLQGGSITTIASLGFWQGKIYGSRPWVFAEFEGLKE
jgi:hypothetical protein